MKKSIIISIALIISGCSKEVVNKNEVNDNSEFIGKLIIPSIDMEYGFYDYEHELNDIKYNIMNVDTNIPNTYLIVAHSGTGRLAYFNDLRYVLIGDEIIIKLDNNTCTYIVKDIIKHKKDGKVYISKDSGYLYLSTCDQVMRGYQLTVVGKLGNCF